MKYRMKPYFFLLTYIFILTACQEQNKNPEQYNIKAEEETIVFFPVGDFLKGQLVEIRERGIAPIQYQTENEHTDSVWIKMDSLEPVLSDFLSPLIDSVSMAQYYTVKKFFDQTLGSVTLTYEANADLPKENPWLSWNIYIDPENGKVQKIYLVKRINENKKLQLSWNCKSHCSITGIEEEEKPEQSKIYRRASIKWNY